MVEIPTTGLKGLYNRINLFSNIIQKDVVDVTMFVEKTSTGSSLATNRVMLATRTEHMINIGENMTPKTFKDTISRSGGNEITEEEYNSVTEIYQPEFNTGTNKIGAGVRKTGNIVMLLSRAESNIRIRRDLFPYEFIQIMANNGVMKEDL